MRTAYALIAVAALTQAGCSALVACTGKRLDTLDTREAVHATFGTPSVVVETDDGRFLEEFVTRRKIAETWKVQGYVMIGTGTCALSELVYLPIEAFWLARNTVVGQRMQVEYDQSGRVLVMRRDGDVEFGTRHDSSTPPPSRSNLPDYSPGTSAWATKMGTARFARLP